MPGFGRNSQSSQNQQSGKYCLWVFMLKQVCCNGMHGESFDNFHLNIRLACGPGSPGGRGGDRSSSFGLEAR